MSRHDGLMVRAALLAAAAAFLPPLSAPGQEEIEEGLLHLVPDEAILVIERRGHAAVRKAMLESNLGELAQDEAILEMVRASRKRFGKLVILRSLFPQATPAEIEDYHKLLHAALRPFWYNPAAFFVVWDPNSAGTPGVGAYCAPGELRDACEEALAGLMKLGLPEKGQQGTRQAFTYRCGSTVWQGVAKGHEPFELPKDPAALAEALKGKTLFMVSWSHPVLCVATSLPVADAVGRALPPVRRKGKPILADEGLQVVLRKTHLSDWAFRWYFNADRLLGQIKAAAGPDGKDKMGLLEAVGIRGMGGTGGYADKVFTRMTYVHAPKAESSILRAVRPGGSYKRGLSMTPGESTFILAGELDVALVNEAIWKMIAGRPREGAARKKAAPAGDKGKTDQVKEQFDKLVANLGGNVGLFVTDLQSLVAGAMGSAGFPVGAVADVKDAGKVAEAVEALIKLGGGDKAPLPEGPGAPAGAEGGPPGQGAYRKVQIRRVGEVLRLAVLKDRIVVALGDNAVKAGIDVALDGIGGLEKGAEATRLLELCGDGSVVFLMDLKSIAKLTWPIVMQLAQSADESFPFASLVSAAKISRMLGPEVAVLRADETGLLMSSRGKIPFSTKLPLAVVAQLLLMTMWF